MSNRLLRGFPIVVGLHDPEADRSLRVPHTCVEAELSEAIVASIRYVLERALDPAETIAAAFQRKEHDLGALFATLSVPQSRALHRRLSAPAVGDELVTLFERLTRDRRARLLAFLADSRRRSATKLAS